MRREFKKKSKVLLIDDNYEHLVGIRELLNIEGTWEIESLNDFFNILDIRKDCFIIQNVFPYRCLLMTIEKANFNLLHFFIPPISYIY